MDAAEIARMQFAVTAGMHFLFVLLTLGLAPTIAIFETRYARTGKPVLLRITRYLGQIYLINYALGILSGLVMEFQLGFAWKGLSSFYGNVIGAPIALETILAFFLESTFLGLWIFGWDRFGKWVHCALFWLVTLTAYMSAFWITVANSWMQHPLGYEVRNGVGFLTDFGAILQNPGVWYAVFHILSAAAIAVGLLLVGMAAWHFLRRPELRSAATREGRDRASTSAGADADLFIRMMRFGAVVTLVGAFVAVSVGFARLAPLEADQPFNYALFSRVQESKIAQAQAAAQAKFGPGDYVPAEWIATASGVMQGMGFLFVTVGIALVALLPFSLIARFRPLLAIMVFLPVLPFVAAIFGWVYRELGRWPWVVYGELRIEDALSPVAPGLLMGSLVIFTALFASLLVSNWWLILRTIGRGPDAVRIGAAPEQPPGPRTPAIEEAA